MVTRFAHAADQKEPLNIYVPGSYTGMMPFLADGILEVVQTYANDANKSGGLLGRKIKVIAQDDKADLATAGKNAEIAIRDPNHFLTIGHSFSSIATPIARLYNSNNKLFLTAYATSPKISEVRGTAFQLCFNDLFQGKTLASVATTRLKAKNILVLTNKTDLYSDGLSEEFAKQLDNHKPKVKVTTYDYIFDRLDVLELSEKIREIKPDLIFLPELKVNAASILRTLATHGHGKIPVLGSDGWGSEEGTLDIFFSGAERSVEGKYFYTYHWHPDIALPSNKKLINRMKQLSPRKPYGPGVLAFEGVDQVFALARSISSVDNLKLAKALRNSTYEGSTGRVRFLPSGVTERDLVLLQLTPSGLKLDSLVKPR